MSTFADVTGPLTGLAILGVTSSAVRRMAGEGPPRRRRAAPKKRKVVKAKPRKRVYRKTAKKKPVAKARKRTTKRK